MRTIHLSNRDYWHEIGELGFPEELTRTLRALMNATLNDLIKPTATDLDIEQAKQYLSDVKIMYHGVASDVCFEIGVFIPDNSETYRKMFVLIPTYPNGKTVRLSEL